MRRAILLLALALLAAGCSKTSQGPEKGTGQAAVELGAAEAAPVLKATTDQTSPGVPFLSWDTEGGKKAATSLLRKGSAVRLQCRQGLGEPAVWTDAAVVGRRLENKGRVSFLTLQAGASRVDWRIHAGDSIELAFYGLDPAPLAPGSLRLLFPFDPKVTATTVLPAEWLDDGTFRLPAVINAPDWGPMLLTERRARPLVGRLEGSRSAKTVDLILEFPDVMPGHPVELALKPLLLPPPEGLDGTSLAMWRAARRGWLNALEPCSRWGEQDKP